MKELNLFLITKKYPWWYFWKKEEQYTIAFNRVLRINYLMNFRNVKWHFHHNVVDIVGYVDYNMNYRIYYKDVYTI